MKAKTPKSWMRLEDRFPEAASAYVALSEACRGCGPLDKHTMALTKLAVSVGGNIERTVHIHAKKALRAGVAPDALRQVAIAALPTIGLPRAMEALRWIEESIDEAPGPTARRRPPRRLGTGQ
jgi:alkylhydroperoxidase/carboxymuconolactone decarboxylase family protein YurZ